MTIATIHLFAMSGMARVFSIKRASYVSAVVINLLVPSSIRSLFISGSWLTGSKGRKWPVIKNDVRNRITTLKRFKRKKTS